MRQAAGLYRVIAGLLLAAGFGRRFGGNKLVAELHGVPIIRRSFGAIAGCDACYVVVPAEHAAIESALGTLAPIFIVNERAEDGMSASIRAGVAALPNNCEAVIIALGDQPFTSPAVAAQLVDAWRETGAPAVVPHYQGGAGHPVLFACETFPALLALNGDMGAKPVLQALGSRVVEIQVDATIPHDVDTRNVLAQLEARHRPDS